MLPAYSKIPDAPHPKQGGFIGGLLTTPLVPVLLGMWIGGLLLVATLAPNQMMLANYASAAVAAGVAAFIFPGVTLMLGLFIFVISPENFLIVSTYSSEHFGSFEVQAIEKILFLGMLLPAVVRHGIRPFLNTGIGAVVILFFMSFTVATIYPSLDLVQMIKSLIGLSLPLVFFNLNIQKSWIIPHLIIIALIPIISVVLGYIAELCKLQAGDGRYWKVVGVEFTGAMRLGGINISAYLAFYCFIAVIAGLYLALVKQKKVFFWISGVSICFALLTGTRTPTLCSIILAGMAIFLSSSRDLRSSSKFLIGLVGTALLAAMIVWYWPSLSERFGTSNTYGESGINTSGRADMWTYMLGVWQVNPIFGRGIGAGAIALLDVHDARLSRAVHNEYIRLLADGGIVGLAIYIIGLATLVISQARYLNQTGRRFIASVFFAFAFYSFTDNTISATPTLIMFYGLALIFAQARFDKAEMVNNDNKKRQYSTS